MFNKCVAYLICLVLAAISFSCVHSDDSLPTVGKEVVTSQSELPLFSMGPSYVVKLIAEGIKNRPGSPPPSDPDIKAPAQEWRATFEVRVRDANNQEFHNNCDIQFYCTKSDQVPAWSAFGHPSLCPPKHALASIDGEWNTRIRHWRIRAVVTTQTLGFNPITLEGDCYFSPREGFYDCTDYDYDLPDQITLASTVTSYPLSLSLQGESIVLVPGKNQGTNSYSWSVMAQGGSGQKRFEWFKIRNGISNYLRDGLTYSEAFFYDGIQPDEVFIIRVVGYDDSGSAATEMSVLKDRVPYSGN